MPHVITQSCCSDGSCVYACPVNCIHPVAGRAGLRHRRDAVHRPGGVRRLRRVCQRLPGRARSRPTAGWTAKQLPFIELNAAFYPERPAGEKLPPTSKLAPVIDAPMVAPRPAGPLTRGDRRLGSGRDVCRRRTADPAGCAGQRVREAAHAVRAGAGRGGARPPEHQAGDAAVRQDRRDAAASRSTSTSRSAMHLTHAELLAHHHAVLYAVGAPDDRRLDIDGHGPAGHRHRHRDGRLDQRPPRLHRICPST